MAAHAGYLPGSNFSEYTKSGKFRSVIQGQGGKEYDLASGWHYKRQAGWRKNVKRHKHELIDTFGNIQTVYSYDTNDIIGHSAHGQDTARQRENLAKATSAFDQSKGDHGKIWDEEGCGHIARLEYAETERILRVTFADGTICVYMDVPTYVAGTLLYFARYKTLASPSTYSYGKQTRERHMLGVEFWNLVRIRGRQTGSKFEFEYETHGTGFVTSSGPRHLVKMTPLIRSLIYGDKYDLENARRPFSENEKILTSLSEEEFNKYALILSELQKMKQLSAKYSGISEGVEGNIDANLSNFGGLQGLDPNGELIKLLDAADDRVKRFTGSLYAEHIMSLLENEGIGQGRALQQFIRTEADNEMKQLINGTTGNTKDVTSLRRLLEVAKIIDPEHRILSYMKQDDRSRNKIGRTWSIQQLKDFANPTIEGNISLAHVSEYKKYITNKDWQGALDFLQSYSTEKFLVDPKTGTKKSLGMQRYAGPNDRLLLDYEYDKEE